jgi:hypothetical protein
MRIGWEVNSPEPRIPLGRGIASGRTFSTDVTFACARLEICSQSPGGFKSLWINDDTFTYACNQKDERPMGPSLGNCKHRDCCRLFVGSVDFLDSGGSCDSGGTKRRPPLAFDSSNDGCSFDDRTVVYDASNRARCHATDHRASFTPDDDICTPYGAPDHKSTAATRGCSAAGAGQPV